MKSSRGFTVYDQLGRVRGTAPAGTYQDAIKHAKEKLHVPYPMVSTADENYNDFVKAGGERRGELPSGLFDRG